MAVTPADALLPFSTALGAFVLIWVTILKALAFAGGWSKLAARYPDSGLRPPSRSLWMQSAKVGWVGYNNCLTLGVGPEGLHLAVWPLFRAGHPPLLIPWDEVASIRPKKIFFMKMFELQVGRGDTVVVSIGRRAGEAAGAYLTGRFPVSTTR